MRRRLRKVFRNEKGFTLVELLAVIAILGIIVAIAVPAIGNITEKAETNVDEAQKELVFDAVRLAELDENENFTFTSGTTTVQDLVDNGYLEATGDFAEDSDAAILDKTIYKDGTTYTFDNPDGK
ncbi:putative major pilin subunit [Paraliobacillus sp. PM-2]|uniref:competence type IV pilus major pilin ComGC n=1 Tax=Paraliobacillus sp. PM-2 TaxID=1462524 RepID=UPI00061CAE5A|nr:prepilin-type N-terminal cleavage/methylation domain-containing protein [Paraliobacillus sp. PM-2]CQR48015.1 putative major pilin subunit [Paraliobacillus sp. PM-2]